MIVNGVQIPIDAIRDLCRKRGIARLSLFGSILRSDFHSGSDVDMLVEFVPGTRIGYIGLSAIQRELSRLVGRPVDLRTAQDLSYVFRDEVVRGAELLHAA